MLIASATHPAVCFGSSGRTAGVIILHRKCFRASWPAQTGADRQFNGKGKAHRKGRPEALENDHSQSIFIRMFALL